MYIYIIMYIYIFMTILIISFREYFYIENSLALFELGSEKTWALLRTKYVTGLRFAP